MGFTDLVPELRKHIERCDAFMEAVPPSGVVWWDPESADRFCF